MASAKYDDPGDIRFAPADSPAILYVVARRRPMPDGRPEYYDGPIWPWTLLAPEALTYGSPASAALVAANFPGAAVVRVYVWHPLPPLVHPEVSDLI